MTQSDNQQNQDEEPSQPEFNFEVRQSPGFFKRLSQSCYRIDFYRIPCMESGWSALFYLLKLVLIVSIFMTGSSYLRMW
ncbi:MAG: hypothetical protein ABEJ65_01495, partial [bacterium]